MTSLRCGEVLGRRLRDVRGSNTPNARRSGGTRFHVYTLSVLALALAACASKGSSEEAIGTANSALTLPLPAATYTVSIKTPSPLAPQDLAIGANGTLRLEPEADIRTTAGDGATIGNVSNGLFDVTELEYKASSGDVWSKPLVDLDLLAHVRGNVYASNVQGSLFAVIDGQIIRTPAARPSKRPEGRSSKDPSVGQRGHRSLGGSLGGVDAEPGT